jgi:hypothetical protein
MYYKSTISNQIQTPELLVKDKKFIVLMSIIVAFVKHLLLRKFSKIFLILNLVN